MATQLALFMIKYLYDRNLLHTELAMIHLLEFLHTGQ